MLVGVGQRQRWRERIQPRRQRAQAEIRVNKMLTIEKFYSSYEEAAPHVTGSSDSTDWHINFVPAADEGVYIKIVMRGREDFRKLIQQIYDVGMGMLEASDPAQARYPVSD